MTELLQSEVAQFIWSLVSLFALIFAQVILPFIAYQLYRLAAHYVNLTKTKVDNTALAAVKQFVTDAVQAAEQRGYTKQIENTAEAKKRAAMADIDIALAEAKLAGMPLRYWVNAKQIDMFIEAALRRGEHKGYFNISSGVVEKED